MATLGQEMRNLRSELQEHPVYAVEGSSQTVDPNQKEDRMQHDSATNAAQTDIPKLAAQEDTKRRTETNIKRKKLPRKKSTLLSNTTKNEDQTIDQNNGLEAKISREETRTILTMDSGENPLLLIRFFLPDKTFYMRITIRIREDHMINAQISHSIETRKIDLETNLSTIRVETG